jgi:phosphoenolpyruvate synthase/pyruvate phosphate dikinase
MTAHKESTRFALPLSEIDPSNVGSFGGKAANLAKLQQAGFNVPLGFVVPSYHFSLMLKSLPTAQSMLERIETTDDFEELLDLALGVQALINSHELPQDLRTGLQGVYKQFIAHTDVEVTGLAVRSSATVEDGSTHSFAGQAESVLCVSGLDALVESVKRVWSSAFSAQAVVYLKTKGIPVKAVKMAVVVQEMVDADVSGVLFTINTVNNDTDQIMIESTWGLGEALVSGKVVPDTYLVDKRSLSVQTKVLGTKTVTFKHGGHCTVKEATPPEMKETYTLSDSEVKRVAELGRRVEERMGSHQDIEWCIRKGDLIVLQARPVTTLK